MLDVNFCCRGSCAGTLYGPHPHTTGPFNSYYVGMEGHRKPPKTTTSKGNFLTEKGAKTQRLLDLALASRSSKKEKTKDTFSACLLACLLLAGAEIRVGCVLRLESPNPKTEDGHVALHNALAFALRSVHMQPVAMASVSDRKMATSTTTRTRHKAKPRAPKRPSDKR